MNARELADELERRLDHPLYGNRYVGDLIEEHRDAILAALRAAPEGWRPIETAPVATFPEPTMVWVVGGYAARPEIVPADGGHWRWCLSEGLEQLPTHWMPLNVPEPPP